MIFGEYKPISTEMPDVSEMEGVYINTRGTFSGMMKWMQLIGIMPLVKSADNTLSNPLFLQRQ